MCDMISINRAFSNVLLNLWGWLRQNLDSNRQYPCDY